MGEAVRRKLSEDSTKAVAWRCDPFTFLFTYVSEEALDLLGYLPERWLHEPAFWRDHLHPEDREWVVSFCKEASAKRSSYEFEYRMLAIDGKVVWIWDAVQVIWEGGKQKELVGVMVDITDRKRREQEMQSAYRSVEGLLSNASDYIFTLAVDGTILYINHSRPGVPQEEVVGASVYDFVAPDFRERMKGYVEGVFRTGEPVEGEMLSSEPGGRQAWYWIRLAPLREEGRTVAVVAVSRDVSLRRQAQDALRESEASLRAFLGAVPELMFRIREDGTLLDVKPGLKEAPALPPGRFLGRKLGELFGEIPTRQILEGVRAALASGRPGKIRYPLAVPFPDGPVGEFEAILSPSGEDEVVAVVRRLGGSEEPDISSERLAGQVGSDLGSLLAESLRRCDAVLRVPQLDGDLRKEVEGIARYLERAKGLLRHLQSFWPDPPAP